jgi:hypothetical protein
MRTQLPTRLVPVLLLLGCLSFLSSAGKRATDADWRVLSCHRLALLREASRGTSSEDELIEDPGLRELIADDALGAIVVTGPPGEGEVLVTMKKDGALIRRPVSEHDHLVLWEFQQRPEVHAALEFFAAYASGDPRAASRAASTWDAVIRELDEDALRLGVHLAGATYSRTGMVSERRREYVEAYRRRLESHAVAVLDRLGDRLDREVVWSLGAEDMQPTALCAYARSDPRSIGPEANGWIGLWVGPRLFVLTEGSLERWGPEGGVERSFLPDARAREQLRGRGPAGPFRSLSNVRTGR